MNLSWKLAGNALALVVALGSLWSTKVSAQYISRESAHRRIMPSVSDIHWFIPPVIQSHRDEENKKKITQLPADVVEKLGMSNNNVAITLHNGRLYAAIRTAAIHHPGKLSFFNHDPNEDESHFFVLSAAISKDALVKDFSSTLSNLQWKLELDGVSALKEHLSPLILSLADEFSTSLEEDNFECKFECLPTFGKLRDLYGPVEAEKVKQALESALRNKRFSRSDLYDYLEKKLLPILWGSDYREPLFVESNGQLYIYIMQVEKNFAFNPLRIWTFNLSNPKESPQPVLSPKEVPWDIRYRKEDGLYYYSGYRGDHYGTSEVNEKTGIQIFLRRSKDGLHWSSDAESEVYRGGGSELSFDWNAQGDWYGVMRLDDGDQRGWGSLLAKKASTSRVFEFPAEADPRRFDSPRMFRMGNELFLLARQNIVNGDETRNAPYDLNFLLNQNPSTSRQARADLLRDIELGKRSNKDIALVDEGADAGIHLGAFVQFEIGQYWHQFGKRTALYWVNQQKNKLELMRNFPSAGDTAFPSVVEVLPGTLLVANYSSPLDNKNISWQRGQFGPTGIYFMLLDFRGSRVW